MYYNKSIYKIYGYEVAIYIFSILLYIVDIIV